MDHEQAEPTDVLVVVVWTDGDGRLLGRVRRGHVDELELSDVAIGRDAVLDVVRRWLDEVAADGGSSGPGRGR